VDVVGAEIFEIEAASVIIKVVTLGAVLFQHIFAVVGSQGGRTNGDQQYSAKRDAMTDYHG